MCTPCTNSIELKFASKLAQPHYNTDISIQDVRQLYTVRVQGISRANGLSYAKVSLDMSVANRSVPLWRGG